MSANNQVLQRAHSSVSNDRDENESAAEEDALLTGQPTQRAHTASPGRGNLILQLSLLTWAVLATVAVAALGVLYHQSTHGGAQGNPKPHGKRNLIFMVSDGMGPTSLSMTRSFNQYTKGLPYGDRLVIDQHFIGQSRTRSSNSLVTDSAAGATAFSCGMKSYNGAISVLPNHEPCGTVLEAAKKAGYMTGLVVTTRITDATPACFAAHVNMRSEEPRIAEQLVGDYPLGRVVDLIFGGGRCFFKPNGTEGSCRLDDKDVIGMAKDNGFNYISSRKEFDALHDGSDAKLPLLGLFADRDVPYEIDRRNENDIYPSLAETTRVALKALSAATRNSDTGFFIMIEGSRIDHAGHGNDPAAQVHEVLAYDEAMAAVLEFIESDDTTTLMVSTSDHETGGLAAARQLTANYPQYLWHPGALANASRSCERLAATYLDDLPTLSDKDLTPYLRTIIRGGLGIEDPEKETIEALKSDPGNSAYILSDLISRRAQIGWSTHGHSAADVNIYTSDPEAAAALRGNHENTEVGEFLASYLGVDVPAITKELREKGVGPAFKGWMGKLPQFGDNMEGGNHLDLKVHEKRAVKERIEQLQAKGHEKRHAEGGCGCGL